MWLILKATWIPQYFLNLLDFKIEKNFLFSVFCIVPKKSSQFYKLPASHPLLYKSTPFTIEPVMLVLIISECSMHSFSVESHASLLHDLNCEQVHAHSSNDNTFTFKKKKCFKVHFGIILSYRIKYEFVKQTYRKVKIFNWKRRILCLCFLCWQDDSVTHFTVIHWHLRLQNACLSK